MILLLFFIKQFEHFLVRIWTITILQQNHKTFQAVYSSYVSDCAANWEEVKA